MATTFKAVVYADNKRQDGTYNIKIRITHNRKNLKVSTNLYAGPNDLTRSLKLKNQDYIDQTQDMIVRWRKIVAKLGPVADSMDVKQIVEHIYYIENHGEVFRLNFIGYGRKVAAAKSKGTGANYNIALNAFCRFLKRDCIDISEITPKLLTEFEKYIENEPVMRGDTKMHTAITDKSKSKGRAVSLYLGCIRHIHNCAKEEYNDEANGVINIPQSPFSQYKVKKQPRPKKKAVPVDIVQRIIELPNAAQKYGPKKVSRRDLARDCALLSLGLAGMNAADLYECEAQVINKKEPVIIYNRIKTRTRRDDEAEMHIRIEPCIMPLVEKYRDPTGERLFAFHKLYTSRAVFNSALKEGLKMVEAEIKGDKHITFYTFRHTWATIARSDALKIDKYTVHEALNHVDSEMKNTDIYIDRDYRPIWNANAELLRLFDWKALLAREKGADLV